eukprot:gnl/TRDRNA2_/TRDRNA2_87830_c0_seq1.p3 gnl/TRDRNA2_/TRDRNA2_87830_c0~~gnl/TRDRNA2_/TRDRNA2_87830_c0_seq1.p3  ORF type:complete len:169 (-),score=27.10 gnl/TRDRNA2_/TRDRNA2_87830_c0_seq1:127-633(-)
MVHSFLSVAVAALLAVAVQANMQKELRDRASVSQPHAGNLDSTVLSKTAGVSKAAPRRPEPLPVGRQASSAPVNLPAGSGSGRLHNAGVQAGSWLKSGLLMPAFLHTLEPPPQGSWEPTARLVPFQPSHHTFPGALIGPYMIVAVAFVVALALRRGVSTAWEEPLLTA